tara:strand:+ start:420 stop:881 length:462 start_codon:yes stop_codon:yes gene_type:complete
MIDDRIEPIWLGTDIAFAVHDRQLAEHRGPSGVRDQGLLESALAKPVNKWGFGENDLCALAAAYAFGVARNHPFTDGNKRTAWVLARTFLVLNDCQLVFNRRRPSLQSNPSQRANSQKTISRHGSANILPKIDVHPRAIAVRIFPLAYGVLFL